MHTHMFTHEGDMKVEGRLSGEMNGNRGRGNGEKGEWRVNVVKGHDNLGSKLHASLATISQ